MRVVKRLLVTFIAFVLSGIIIALWQEFLPTGAFGGALMAVVPVALVLGTWRWSGTYFKRRLPAKVEVFDIVCASLLLHLYERFPEWTAVQLDDLPLDHRLDGLDEEAIWDWHNTFDQTVIWLEKEGFVHAAEKSGNTDPVKLSLTSRALNTLRRVPPAIDGANRTLAEQIENLLNKGVSIEADEQLRTLIQDIKN